MIIILAWYTVYLLVKGRFKTSCFHFHIATFYSSFIFASYVEVDIFLPFGLIIISFHDKVVKPYIFFLIASKYLN